MGERSLLPNRAQVVIIGGGSIGTSIAYHLTKLGWRDVVLIERGQLTSGTTWHAAGLVTQIRASHAMTDICRYGVELFPKLEAETGLQTGFKRRGYLVIARNEDRLHELRRQVSLAKVFDIEAREVSPAEAAKIHPLVNQSTIVGAISIPGDGQINPVDLTNAFAKGARLGGAKILEGVTVTGFEKCGGRVKAVVTDQGTIECEKVVLACGLWTRDLAAKLSIKVPLYATEHMYILTEEHRDITPNLPVIRDPDGYCYIKEDTGKLMVGSFEPNAKPLPISSLPENQQFIQLPEDWDQFEFPMSKAIEAVPLIGNLGIRHFMNGPESFTPDNRFIIGEAPTLPDVFVAAGMNSQGILASAGIGRAMAAWIVEGQATTDLSEIDIARFAGYETNQRFLRERIREIPGYMYDMHWPHKQFETARQVRTTPLYDKLKARRACFGTSAGMERANWYAPDGVEPAYKYSYGRQNWFDFVAEEHRAAREGVALFDLSSFGKTLIQGRDACASLQRLTGTDLDRPVGSIIYCQLLNRRGGIESDLTFTRLDEDRFLMLTSAAQQQKDLSWITQHSDRSSHLTFTDVSAGFGTICLSGPLSRQLLQAVSDDDFSNEAFPFGTAREISIGFSKTLALRISFTGELGWELYPTTDMLGPIFDTLMQAGEPMGLRLAGYHALDSLRLEKGFVHWGHDVSPAENPVEAGLGFTISKSKTDYIGFDAIAKARSEPPRQRRASFRLDDTQPTLLHNEPIYRNGELVGRITSGGFGYTIGRPVGMGYVSIPQGQKWQEHLKQGEYAIEIAGVRFPAQLSIDPLHDPQAKRQKA
ncbi:GcvT family protein [Mesorhizobium silamurunense]|uniref:GcvT family protein n=1 Tax=Mesorhizobium silamurunense TaxID=499528 RepID=UPI00177D23BA|nr:FAD-dependent oxidoreductase [Mesorhizobium silamurunense]